MDQKKFSEENASLTKIRRETAKVVVGLDKLVDRLLISLLCNGHVLIEGIPGLAKTLTVSTLSTTINSSFSRIQFTPDLLPSDLIGTLIYNQKSGDFIAHKGPVFANIVLADEINRSPAKVQSALLEAMQEKQVTIGKDCFKLEEPFLVLATQNPIEQEGTYPLPEAQLDRFMFKVNVGYPSLEDEHLIMKRMSRMDTNLTVNGVIETDEILKMRRSLDEIHCAEEIEKYILHIIDATRFPERYELDHLKPYISFGCSPRAGIFMLKGAKAQALLEGRDYVVPADVKELAYDILRHRIGLSYRAEAEDITSDSIIEKILNKIDITA